MFYESTERVTDRRIALNKYNYTASAATLAAIAFVFQWSESHDKFMIYGVMLIGAFSLSGFMFCTAWIGQLDYFKNLNTSKFNVINQISRNIIFSESKTESFKPFEKEWEEVKSLKKKGIEKGEWDIFLKTSNIEYGTNAEKILPNSFRVIFGCITFLSLVFIH